MTIEELKRKINCGELIHPMYYPELLEILTQMEAFEVSLRYCVEQITRRGWEKWDGSFEVSDQGHPYHVQILVQPTGDNPWNRNR